MKDMDWTVVEAREQFEGLLALVEQLSQEETALHEVERSLFRLLLALGRTLLEHFLQEKGVGDYGPSLGGEEGTLLVRGEIASRSYRSIFGEIAISRYVYGEGEARVAPLDAALHLPEWRYSYLLQEWGLTLSCQQAFAEAGQTLEQILGMGLGVAPLERLSRKVSEGVVPFRAEQPPPDVEEEAPLLVATVDCKGIPLTRAKGTSSKQGKRRKKGEKKTKKKMACVGAVYSIDPFVRTPDDILDEVQRERSAPRRPIPCHKRVEAQLLADKATLFASLAHQVDQRHIDPSQPVLFLGDGERRLWTLQERYLPQAIGILDLWHVMEYLWKGAHLFHAEGSLAAEDWVGHRLGMLLEGKVGYLIGGLKQMQTKHVLKDTAKKTLQGILTYFHNNRRHMRYDEYLAKGYPIGSGVAEGACRHLVKDRLERTGMRWTEEGAQAILDLRSVYLNGDGEAYWTHYTDAEDQRLYGHVTCDPSGTYRAAG